MKRHGSGTRESQEHSLLDFLAKKPGNLRDSQMTRLMGEGGKKMRQRLGDF